MILVHLERIQYIQRVINGDRHRSARNFNKTDGEEQLSNNETKQKMLEIYYTTDRSRSQYLYKCLRFQLELPGNKIFFLSKILIHTK